MCNWVETHFDVKMAVLPVDGEPLEVCELRNDIVKLLGLVFHILLVATFPSL